MKHFIRHNFPGFELGLVVGFFTFISLVVFLPSASQGRRFTTYTICLSENATPETAARMRTTIEDDILTSSHRYLGLDGLDLLWGYNPSPFFLPDTRIRFGLLVVPVLVFGITMLVYVAVVRCRYLVSGYSPPHTAPSPSETS